MADVVQVPEPIEGQVEHDAPFGSARPVTISGRYAGAPPAVAEGDVALIRTDITGILLARALGEVGLDSPVGDSGPLMAGRASAAEPSAVSADGDLVAVWADRLGRQVVVEGHPSPESPVVLNATALGDTQVIAAPGAGQSLYIQRVWLSNNAAAKVKAALREGAAGTIRARGTLAADGGGVMLIFTPWWKLAANTALTVNLAATGDVEVNVLDYFIAP